jgi:hypothetical protein
MTRHIASVPYRVWHKPQAVIIDICIALASLNLPVYVLLWIVDWLPEMARAHTEFFKVDIIESALTSIQRVRKARELAE